LNETLDDARRGIGGYVDRYHHRPHSRLGYKTPYLSIRPGKTDKTSRPNLTTPAGSTSLSPRRCDNPRRRHSTLGYHSPIDYENMTHEPPANAAAA
jgi:transposase InsO family protein